MKRTFALLGVVVLLVGCPLASMAQTPAAAPTPGPEHQRLGYFVGKWTTEGEAKPSPMGPGGKMLSTDTCEWFEGRFAVVCHFDGKTPMGPSKGLGILSYSTEEKVYTYYGLENSNMAMTTVSRGTLKGDTWTYENEATMGGQKMKMRVTLKELSPTAYTFKMEVGGPDGKYTSMVEAKSTKK